MHQLPSFFLYLISLYCFSSFTTISLQLSLAFFLFLFWPKLSYSRFCSMILQFKYMKLKVALYIKMLFLFLSPSLPLNLLLHLSCLHIYFYCSQVFHLRLLVTHNPLYGSKSALWKAFCSVWLCDFSIWLKRNMKQNTREPIRPCDFRTN